MSLNIENLRVSLQKKKILHGIDLEIQEGEFVSLLGKSGCGKNHSVKCIAGLLEQESGDISDTGSICDGPAAKREGNGNRVSGFAAVSPYDGGEKYCLSHGTQKGAEKKSRRSGWRHCCGRFSFPDLRREG